MSAPARRTRQAAFLPVHVVDEAAYYLVRHEVDWCRDMALESMTAVARHLVALAALRLGWDELRADERGLAALVCTSLHDVLGATRFERLLAGARSFIRAEHIRRMAPLVVARLAEVPSVRQTAHSYLADVRGGAGPDESAGREESDLATGSASADDAGAPAPPALGHIGDIVAATDGELAELVDAEPAAAPAAPAGAVEAAADDSEVGVEELPLLAARVRGPPSSQPQWPMSLGAGQAGLAWQPERGRMLYDAAAGQPAPHIRRVSGEQPVLALNPGRSLDYRKWSLAQAPLGRRDASPDGALATLLAWLSARPAIRGGVYRATVQSPPGVEFGVGFWVRLDLAGVRPGTADEVQEGMRRSYHGTALAVLARIVQEGVCTGMAENISEGHSYKGIWSLAPQRARLLTSYILYSALDRSGYVFGPVVELRSPSADPNGRRIVLKRGSGRRNRDQWLSYPDTTQQVAVWVHVLHIAEMAASDTEAAVSIFAEGRIPPGLEIHPDCTWEEICERSAFYATAP